MARLIIHAGLGKTGTTALQTWLTRAKGLPGRGILHAGLELERLPGRFRLSGQGAVSDPAQLAEGLAKIEAAAARPGVETIVWSNESIGMTHARRDIAAALSAFLARSTAVHALEVVLVLRRQDEWIESAYRQWGLRHKMRRGYGVMTPRQYLASVAPLLDYRRLYAEWRAAAGATVRVLSYDDVMAGGGMAPVFARDVLGLDPTDFPAEGGTEGRVHVSPGPALSYFHALYNAGCWGGVMPEAFGDVIAAHDLPELAPKTAAFFGRAIRREILSKHRENNDLLAQEALGRPRLFARRPVADVTRYAEGPQHALTYLAIIAARQQAMIEGRAMPEGPSERPPPGARAPAPKRGAGAKGGGKGAGAGGGAGKGAGAGQGVGKGAAGKGRGAGTGGAGTGSAGPGKANPGKPAGQGPKTQGEAVRNPSGAAAEG